MACHGCAAKFGFFEKELGCPNCGFAYCKKCLRYEAKDPKKEGSKRNVCVKCHIKHAEMEVPPDAMDKHADKFRKCIETMSETDTTAKYEFNDPKGKFPTMRDAFDHETQQLVERVNKLDADYKKSRPKVEIEEELKERLNKLKGRPSGSKEPVVAYKAPVKLSETEESNRLMQQLLEEQSLAKDLPKPDLELEARLARLLDKGATKLPSSKEKTVKKVKGKEPAKPKTAEEKESLPSTENGKKKGVWGLEIPENLDADEEEAAVQSIVKKALLDAKLETELQMIDYEDKEKKEIEEQKQFPWCVVCNENATQRCIDCDGDLYCDACFSECCKPEDHLSEPFVGNKEDNSSDSS